MSQEQLIKEIYNMLDEKAGVKLSPAFMQAMMNMPKQSIQNMYDDLLTR